MTDADLLAGIANHDPAALSYLYDRYHPPVARQTRKLGGNEADAFDVFQESVTILYLNVRTGKYQPQANAKLSTYLQGIAKNVWRGQQRKQKKLATVVLSEGQEPTLPETDPELRDRIERVEAALATLGDKCRRLLRLFYFEKLPLRRIAELMTFTEQTAKNSKYRCVQQLRAKLNHP
jgi:RNA polymerase sigma factor (sigma-70 family)